MNRYPLQIIITGNNTVQIRAHAELALAGFFKRLEDSGVECSIGEGDLIDENKNVLTCHVINAVGCWKKIFVLLATMDD